MEDYTKNRIINKIKAVNEVNKVFNKYVPRIAEISKEFIGKEILKKSYLMTKRFSDKFKPILEEIKKTEIKPLKEGDDVRVNVAYLKASEYHIYLNLSVCFSGGSYEDRTNYCTYEEGYSYLINIKDRVLKEIIEHKPREEININEQLEIYNKCQEKKRELETEKDKLFYGFRGDF